LEKESNFGKSIEWEKINCNIEYSLFCENFTMQKLSKNKRNLWAISK